MEKFVFFFVIALCGTCANSLTTEDGTNRIIGGIVASEGQFRYTISLQQLSQISHYTRGHRCGGALITLQHALTSATCLYNFVGGNTVLINPNEFRVFAGAVSLTNDGSSDRFRSIANFTVHPQYTTANLGVNDIAIITLTTPFPSTAVSVVAMTDRDATPQQINACNVAGWGAQNATSTVSVLLTQSTKSIFDSNSCQALHAQFAITQNMICANNIVQPSAGCQGDLGNPLVCNGNLTGIYIRGHACTPSQIPEVYTRVSAYRNWVNTVLRGGASTFQPAIAVLAIVAVAQLLTSKVLN